MISEQYIVITTIDINHKKVALHSQLRVQFYVLCSHDQHTLHTNKPNPSLKYDKYDGRG